MLHELLLGLVAGGLIELVLVIGAVLVRGAQLIEERSVPRPTLVEVLDPLHRLADELAARLGLFRVPIVVAAPEPHGLDHERQGQALAGERHENHRERDRDDRVARGHR